MSMSIPRVIYTIWVARDGSDSDPPAKYREYDESWRRCCKIYEHKLLRTSDIEYMWRNEPALAEFRQVYQKMRLIERCDFSRYALMMLVGGLYVDKNVMCFRNIDPLLAGRDIALVREPVEMQSPAGVVKVGNQFLASVAGHPFWLALMKDIRSNYKVDHTNWHMVLENTGPIALGRSASRRLPASAFIDTCAILPYVHTGNLGVTLKSVQCRNTPDEQIYAAKIWQDTACWSNSDCHTRFVPWRAIVVLLLITALASCIYKNSWN